MNTHVDGKIEIAENSSCTSHCSGQCTPACSGGGHCVANVSVARRPTRQDMLQWIQGTKTTREAGGSKLDD